MRKNISMISIAIGSLLLSSTVYSESKSETDQLTQANQKIEVVKVKKMGRAPRIEELQKRLPSKERQARETIQNGAINSIMVPDFLKRQDRTDAKSSENKNGASTKTDMSVKRFDFGALAPSALLSIEGYSNDDNAALIGGRITPPDTNGDVGREHYVQYVNLGWVFFNKSDGSVAGGPFVGNSFWDGFGGLCESENAGDPVVVYDQFAERWLFTQFTGQSGDGHQCLAVSDGEDPAGPYTLYDFVVSENAFNDYPKLTVWPDGYYLSIHEFVGNSFDGFKLVVLDREAILAGDANASFIRFEGATSGANPDFGAAVGHLEGADLPPVGTCNRVIHATDAEAFGLNGSDRYRFWEACVDFDNPDRSTLDQVDSVNVPEFDVNFCGFSRDCIRQPGNQRLDGLAGFTLYRFSNRYFPGDNQLKGVVTNNVDVGSDRAGVQWAAFDIPPASGSTIEIAEDGDALGIVDFNDNLSRWMGSATIDKNGNLGIGYTRSGTDSFPSVYFTVREMGVDAAGAVQAESTCVDGTGSITGANRWADYSSTSIDPVDGCTFWTTNEYVETTGNFEWNTRVCSFKIASCDGGPVNEKPDASFEFSCDGLSCSFDGSASSDSDGTVEDYAWDFGDGNTGNGVNAANDYAGAGTYLVTLTVTDNGNATGTVSQEVTVIDPNNLAPEAVISATCTDLTCDFDAAASTDSDGNIVSYAWDFGDGSSGSGVTTSKTYGAEGEYKVTLTVTDDDNATGDAVQDVTVTEPVSNITISLNGRGGFFSRVQVFWEEANGNRVDVYRDGNRVTTTNNDGSYTNFLGFFVRGTFTYQVCEQGTNVCSPEADVTL